jgi:hypothetical protein
MQKLELYYWMDKQLTDLLDSAAGILTGKPSDTDISDFFKRSAGVTRFIRHHIPHSDIQNFLYYIPEIEYKPLNIFGKVISAVRRRTTAKGYILTRKAALAEVKAYYDIFAAIYNLHQAEAA